MDQIISFDKSLQARLQDYEEVFSSLKSVPYSKLQGEWAYYLEFTLDPNGWQAIWKIPRIKCEEFEIQFPTVVLVYVLNVNYANLTALVRILAVQDDIHLVEKHEVPLTQLWPTKQQDKSIGLNLNSTANALDMLRFFYIHLLMPWDEDEDKDEDSADWKGAHLISRLRLHYDLRNGKIPKATSEHIYALLNEARRLNSKRQQLATLCHDYDSDVEAYEDKNVENLIEINVRLIEIKNEINLYENELFRKVLLKRQDAFNNTNPNPENIWIVSERATANDYTQLLKYVNQLYPNELISFVPQLMSKLESANQNDIVLLSPNKHLIKGQGALLENIVLKGLGDNNKVEVVSQVDDVMFDSVGDSVVLENITFNCKTSQCAFLIRKGRITIKNCQLIGDNSSTTRQGVLVLNGAKLTLESCDISGFSVAVIGNSGSKIVIKDSAIHDTCTGIKLFHNSEMSVCKSSVRNCREFGIVVETEEELESNEQAIANSITNDFKALDGISYVNIESLEGGNNGKGDAVIKKSNITAIEDLFGNPDLDPTIIDDSDEEMETSQANITVLETKCQET